MNNRRKLILALGAATLASPLSSRGQPQFKVWRIGFLGLRRPVSLDTDFIGAFPQGMRELGYVEGKNLVIEWRSAEGKSERLPGLATELVNLKPDVIVTSGTPATDAVQKATATIPIVMASVADPVSVGLVKNLARPGGNTTGVSNLIGDLGPKHLEMLVSMVPKLSRVAVLVDPDNSVHNEILKNVRIAALRIGVNILRVEARNPLEIEHAFSLAVRENARAIIVLAGLFNQHLRQTAELAAKHRLSSIAAIREYVEAGGLMSYGDNRAETYRRAATYVAKILKGAKPADLPVEQPTRFELIINGKTAKALGLKIPNSLLVMADKVIE